MHIVVSLFYSFETKVPTSEVHNFTNDVAMSFLMDFCTVVVFVNRSLSVCAVIGLYRHMNEPLYLLQARNSGNNNLCLV